MFARRSLRLAQALAEALGGNVAECLMSIGLRLARHCVTASYKRMAVKVFVFAPHSDVWVENFRPRSGGETIFSVNAADHVMGLVQEISDAFRSYRTSVFVRPGSDATKVQNFCHDVDNDRDIAALGLGKGERLTFTASQILLRNKRKDAPAIMDRLDIVNRIFERNGGARSSQSVTDDEYRIAVGEVRAAGTRDGRAPTHTFGGELEPVIQCRNCSRPAHLLLSLDTADPTLEKLPFGTALLPLVHCLNCQVHSTTFSIRFVGHHWTLLDQADNQKFDDFPDRFPEKRVDLIRVTGAGSVGKHKLGGAPSWIQSAEDPDCPICGRPMVFLAQLATDSSLQLQFGDDGLLYAFLCAKCRVISSLIQSR